MKKFYISLALVLGGLVTAQAQTVFSTSLESWSAGLPTDMYGNTSNIAAGSVNQVTGSSDYGNNCVRLDNATSTHRRFTTQPMSVVDTKTYQINFWVKGNGEIRTGMFDGRSTGFGYATYNPYLMINSSTWTMYSQTITCANDTTAGEFIFSTRNTVAPDHIMIDSIIITEVSSAPVNASIYQIQYTTASPANSPYNGQNVITGGIVSAYYFNGYFLQAGGGAWHGIEVYDTTNTVASGDSVIITATVQEFFNNTRLNNVTAFTVVSSGNPIPNPYTITTTQGNTEDFEGCLVKTTSVCTDDNSGFGMWTVYTAPDSLRIDDLMYSFTPTVGFNYEIIGCASYSFGEFKLNPRKPSDVTVLSGVEENELFNGVSVYPNPATEYFTVTNLPVGGSIQVIDLNGKTVLQSTTATVKTSGLNRGMYFVKVQHEDSAKTLKLIVR